MDNTGWVNIQANHKTSNDRSFYIQGVGAYCGTCELCQHHYMVTPNITHQLKCPHCLTQLELPLEAHFACPATSGNQFAVKTPLDVEKILYELTAVDESLANSADCSRLVLGSMDVTVIKSHQQSLVDDGSGKKKNKCGGVVSRILSKICCSPSTPSATDGKYTHIDHLLSSNPTLSNSTRYKKALAVLTEGGSLALYKTDFSKNDKCKVLELIQQIPLDHTRIKLKPNSHTSSTDLCVTISSKDHSFAMMMDPGSGMVASNWKLYLEAAKLSQDNESEDSETVIDDVVEADIASSSHIALRMVPI